MKALIVAGEASGDIYGEALASVLRRRLPDLSLAGMGGDRMQRSGVDLVYHYGDISVVGVFEVFSKLQMLREAFHLLTSWIKQNSPDFVILIDFPDFNFRLAKFLKKHKIKTFYFISPQIWAWRKGRIHFLKKHIDLMVSILPFEKQIYDEQGIRSVYVGHPLLEIVQEELRKQPIFPKPGRPLLGLMPGSRDVEIQRHLPVLLEAAEILRRQMDLDVLLIRAPSVHSELYNTPDFIQLVTHDRYAAMKACDFMIVASGTSTLEAAVLNVPFIIVYKVGKFSWRLGKILVRVPYYGLVNWIAKKKIVPEFMQDRMRADLLAKEAKIYLTESTSREKMKANLLEVVKLLGGPGAMDRAADAILALL